jgi:Flp pilus assembly protein TadG
VPQRLRSESGQVVALFAVLLIVLFGVAALVIDVGVWFAASRNVQGTADAAALAAAQELPNDPARASSEAASYTTLNNAALSGSPAFSPDNSTVTVTVQRDVPSVFAKNFGLTSETIKARATAQTKGASCVPGRPSTMPDGQPIPFVVSTDAAPPNNPFGVQTTLGYGPSNPVGPGEFGLIDLSDGVANGNPGTIASWIDAGYNGTICTGGLPAINGNKTMPSSVVAAMNQLVQSRPVVLLPVYSGTDWSGNLVVVGWAAFHLTGWDPTGPVTTLTGSFQRWPMDVPGPAAPEYFGVGSLRLIG